MSITLQQIEKVIYEKRRIPADALSNVYVFGSRMYGSNTVVKPQVLQSAIAKTQAEQQQQVAAATTMANDYDIYVVVDTNKYPNLLQEIDNTLDEYQQKLPSHIFTALINPIVKVWLDDNKSQVVVAMDITFKTREEYINDVHNMDPTALACASLHCHKNASVYNECCFKETLVLDVPLIPSATNRSYHLFKLVKKCFEISVHRGSRMLTMRNDYYNGIKNFFHACRNLLFKIQVLKHGYVTDYTAGNETLKQLYADYEACTKQENYVNAGEQEENKRVQVVLEMLQQKYGVEERDKLYAQFNALLYAAPPQQQ